MKFARLCQYGAALVWAIACHAGVSSTDGNTSWMSMCKTSADCSGRMTCECGLCTNTCAMDAVCGDDQSACAKAGSPAFSATCGEGSTLAGVCLPRCPEEGCGAGSVCTHGLCTRSVAAEPRRDSGPGPSRDAAPEPSSGQKDTVNTAATCESVDYSGFQDGPDISFRDDLLPMFGLSCSVSDCHAPRDHKAGLNLGYKCAYDANAKWKCTFPAVGGADPSTPQPDDEQTIAQIYADLLAPAASVSGGLVKRVVPGDPANSFLVLKLADKQNSRGYACVNQDPSHESNPPPCGVSMPQNQELYCQGTYQPRFEAIVRWIAQGAKNN